MCVMTAFEVIIIICIKRCFHVREKQNKKFSGGLGSTASWRAVCGRDGGCTFRYFGRKILFKNNRYLHDKFLQSAFVFTGRVVCKCQMCFVCVCGMGVITLASMC